MKLFVRSAPTDGDAALAEAHADVAAVTAVVRSLADARTVGEAIGAALDAVRTQFGWAYGSYWHLDGPSRALRFVQESGAAGEEFRRVTLTASFSEGVGLSGR